MIHYHLVEGFKVEFKSEKFIHFFNEALLLFKAHHSEVGNYFDDSIEFDPDIENYIKLDDHNHLKCFTVRKSGKLIGYCIHHIFKHLHFRKSLQSVQDALFIVKEHRGIGKEFISWVDDELKSEGIQAVYHYVSINHDYSKALTGLGYKKIESTYLRRLH